MPRKRVFTVGDQVVTQADIRRWMQSVGSRVSAERKWQYVKQYDVVGKIAAAKAGGYFDAVIKSAAHQAGVNVRAARKPGILARVRLLRAANDTSYEAMDRPIVKPA